MSIEGGTKKTRAKAGLIQPLGLSADEAAARIAEAFGPQDPTPLPIQAPQGDKASPAEAAPASEKPAKPFGAPESEDEGSADGEEESDGEDKGDDASDKAGEKDKEDSKPPVEEKKRLKLQKGMWIF